MSVNVLRYVWKWIYSEIFNSSGLPEYKGNKIKVWRVFSPSQEQRRLLGLLHVVQKSPKVLGFNFYFLGNCYLQLQQQLNVLTIFVTSQLQEYNGSLRLIIFFGFTPQYLKLSEKKNKKQKTTRIKIENPSAT